MTVVVPMAGRGSRYGEKGYNIPKPLIEIEGKQMFLWALESLANIAYEKIIFIALKQHEQQFTISKLLNENLKKSFQLVLIDEVTEGQLCTVLKAKEFINKDDDLLIIASDTLIRSNIGKDIQNKDGQTKGIISVINLPGDRWSFAKADKNGSVSEVAEKVRISDHASTGIYYFSKAGDFFYEGEMIIKSQEKTKGEYYIIPVYQKFIEKKEKVKISIADEMWDMGTPEAKEIFENHLRLHS
ncbi:MAG: glycosyltransferase family 2 protein [Bacteroidota bacterium]|nr:glycosyltransferase family 2 protein [Bacteroidota bacterium]